MWPNISRFPEVMANQDASDKAFGLQMLRVFLGNPTLQNSFGLSVNFKHIIIYSFISTGTLSENRDGSPGKRAVQKWLHTTTSPNI
jgi:hypothetical protein